MPQSILLFICFFMLSFFNLANSNDAGIEHQTLTIENPWIAEAPPVSNVMAAYLTIKNSGQETITVTRAESDLYSSIEFHETKHEDGLARMVRHPNLSIPANGKLVLKRGGKHLMLFNPTKRLKEGDQVTIELFNDNILLKTISVPVKKAQL